MLICKTIKINRILLKNIRSFSDFNPYIPKKLIPYLKLGRYDKPIGTLLLYLPCTWGIVLGIPTTNSIDFFKYLGLFGFGSVMLRSAGCAINDLWDKEFDKNVERTKTRPLAANLLTNNQAYGFIFCHLMGGLAVLTQLNYTAIILSFGIVPIITIYPLAKRFTHYPQAVLGTAFNWGIVSGFAATKGYIDFSIVLPAYFAGIAWTLIYDTIYAHQDKSDDIKIGVKSTALKWGDNTKYILNLLNIASFAGLSIAAYSSGCSSIVYPLIGISHLYLMNIIKEFDINDRITCNEGFVQNRWFGLLILCSFILGKNQEDDINNKENKNKI